MSTTKGRFLLSTAISSFALAFLVLFDGVRHRNEIREAISGPPAPPTEKEAVSVDDATSIEEEEEELKPGEDYKDYYKRIRDKALDGQQEVEPKNEREKVVQRIRSMYDSYHRNLMSTLQETV